MLYFNCHLIFLHCYVASVFGEQKRLEPMQPERKVRWRKEIDWLLSVTDHIVELVPTVQKTNGVNMEVRNHANLHDSHLSLIF